jgi:hypothetical protein
VLTEGKFSHGGEVVSVGLLSGNAVWTCEWTQRFGGTYCLHLQPLTLAYSDQIISLMDAGVAL